MCLIKSILSKSVLPVMVVLLSLFSCSKGGEPIPTASVDNSNASSIMVEGSTNETSRLMNVVGGDDHEDDDDNKESDITSRGR